MPGRERIDVTRCRVSNQVGKGWALMLNTSGEVWRPVPVNGREYWLERDALVAALRALRIRVDRHGWVHMIITT
jgi:hypothetical protein